MNKTREELIEIYNKNKRDLLSEVEREMKKINKKLLNSARKGKKDVVFKLNPTSSYEDRKILATNLETQLISEGYIVSIELPVATEDVILNISLCE